MQGEKGEEGQDGRDGSKGESGEKGFRGHPGLTGAEGTPVKKYPYLLKPNFNRRVYLVQEGQVEIRETQGLQANLACQGYQGNLEQLVRHFRDEVGPGIPGPPGSTEVFVYRHSGS